MWPVASAFSLCDFAGSCCTGIVDNSQPDKPTDASIQTNLLVEVLGPHFLAYLLNLTLDELSTFLDHDLAQDTSLRRRALTELSNFIGGLDTTRGPLWHLDLDILGIVDEGQPTSWPNRMRLQLGGSDDTPSRRGRHRQLLIQLAQDLYPLFLIPQGQSDPFWPSTGRAAFAHPQHAELQAAILADPTLSKLFPTDMPGQSRMGYVMHSTGQGGTLQAWGFPEMMLKAGWKYACLEHVVPSLQEFCDGVLWAVDIVQRAVAGKPVKVPARTGLTGVLLEQTTPIEMSWGTIRRVRETDASLIPSQISGELGTTRADGEAVQIKYSGDLVLETDVSYKLVVTEWDPTNTQQVPVWPTDLRAYELTQAQIESVQLGLMLGVEQEQRATVLQAWSTTLDPLSYSGTSWRHDLAYTAGLVPCRLTKSETSAWQSWIEIVSKHRTAPISVAITRTLRAAMERRDPADALLDAVIAWENLVGTDEGETTLRITTALAWLLGKDATTREELVTKLRKLYKLRSDIVHGSSKVTLELVGQHYQDALNITLEALRVLFRDRPDLLAESTGSARSKRLMLNLPAPSAVTKTKANRKT